MAYDTEANITAGRALTHMATGYGFSHYRYDSIDVLDLVEDAGYFNNVDDNLNLAKGDKIEAYTWATAVRTGTVSEAKPFVVTNVQPRDAVGSPGAVNIAEMWITTGISSGD